MNEEDLPYKKFKTQTSLVMNEEFKLFLLNEIKIAQYDDDINNRNPYCIRNLTKYDFYHNRLTKFLNKNKQKGEDQVKQSQADNLVLMVLLTYPAKMIREFTDFSKIVLWGSTKHTSDFIDEGGEIGDMDTTTCVCNEPLKYIHRFKNKFTGEIFNVGSVCNGKYGIINLNDPNYVSTEKKLRQLKEKEREKKEGLPEGHYENERKNNKENKAEKARLKEEEKAEKTRLKEEVKAEKERLKEEELLFYLQTHGIRCVLCQKHFINNDKSCTLKICGKCSTKKQKDDRKQMIFYLKFVKSQECVGCEVFFFRKLKNDMCKKCGEFEKIMKCSMSTCANNFICDKKSQDLYCNDCDEKIVNCLDCKKNKVILPNLQCYRCEFNFINKQITKVCLFCEDEFSVKEENKWKTYCVTCFKFCHSQNISVSSKIVLKKCEKCTEQFAVNEKYKTNRYCRECYYKK